MRALLVVAALALALAGARADRPVRPEMTGTDYGDLLDSIRARLQLNAHERDPESAGNIGQIRNMLHEIKRGLIREQQASDKLFGGIRGDYETRQMMLAKKINATKEWLDNARNHTKANAARIVELTQAINDAPQKQAASALKVAEWNSRVDTLRAERRTRRQRFARRQTETKDTLAGLHTVMDVVGRTQGDVEIFNTTLKAALNRHNSPKLRALLQDLGQNLVFASQDDLDDLRLLFRRMHQQLHEFLLAITRTQVAYNERSKEQLARLVAIQTRVNARHKELMELVPNSQEEIKRLIEETSKAHHAYPYKVTQLHRTKKALKRLAKSHRPLVAQHERDRQRRDEQLAKVAELLHIVRQRYDRRPGIHKPHVVRG